MNILVNSLGFISTVPELFKLALAALAGVVAAFAVHRAVWSGQPRED